MPGRVSHDHLLKHPPVGRIGRRRSFLRPIADIPTASRICGTGKPRASSSGMRPYLVLSAPGRAAMFLTQRHPGAGARSTKPHDTRIPAFAGMTMGAQLNGIGASGGDTVDSSSRPHCGESQCAGKRSPFPAKPHRRWCRRRHKKRARSFLRSMPGTWNSDPFGPENGSDYCSSFISTPPVARVKLTPWVVDINSITTPFWFFMLVAAGPPPTAAPAAMLA